MKKFIPVALFLITIGVIAVGINMIFGYGTITFVERVRINGIWIYKYNLWNYISEVKNSLTTTARIQLSWQTRTWTDLTDTAFTNKVYWDGLANNLAYMLNVIIFALNVVLYPIRIGAYALSIIGSILGLPVLTYESGNSLEWLYQTLEFLVELQIPYV